MAEEHIFEIDSVSLENMHSLAMEQGRNLELRICEASFIAEKIADSMEPLLLDGMSMYEVITLLSEELSVTASAPDISTPDETLAAVKSFLSVLSALDKAELSRLVAHKLTERSSGAGENDFLFEADTAESLTYVRSALADEAYDVFSQEFSDPRVAYADSLKEACFAVADGKVGYCILPFEDKGSRIPSISNLVAALDLKIVAITPVFGFEGTADMKYALVGRSFRIPERSAMTDRYLEISVSKDAVPSLAELLLACEHLGVSVYRVSTNISDNDSSSVSYSLILKDGGGSFTELLIYLSLFASAYTPVGIYKNIE